jgi:hypothetical protein
MIAADGAPPLWSFARGTRPRAAPRPNGWRPAAAALPIHQIATVPSHRWQESDEGRQSVAHRTSLLHLFFIGDLQVLLLSLPPFVYSELEKYMQTICLIICLALRIEFDDYQCHMWHFHSPETNLHGSILNYANQPFLGLYCYSCICLLSF